MRILVGAGGALTVARALEAYPLVQLPPFSQLLAIRPSALFRRLRPRRVTRAMGAFSLLVVACSTPPPAQPRAALPSYGPEDALTLDDSFSGHLFETAFVPGEAGDDAHFDERAAAAESIWLLKVATVSKEGSLGNNRRYSVSFRTLETLAGPPPKRPSS